MADFIAAKLAAKKALDRAQTTVDQTLAMLEEANKLGLMSVMSKYQKQLLRQRDNLAECRLVYEELNKAVAPSPQIDMIPPAADVPAKGRR